MHWFDDFTKSVAGSRPSRSAMLDGLVRLAAGVAIAPLAAGRSPAFATQIPADAPGRARIVPGSLPKSRRWQTNQALQRGPCSVTVGPTNSLNFTASSSSLKFTMTETRVLEGSSPRSKLGGNFTIEITDDGESILHLESRFRGWVPSTDTAPDATLAFRYGSKVRGVSNADLSLRGGSIGGTIDGRALRALDQHGPAPTSVRFSDGHELAIEANRELHDKLSDLADAVKSGFAACRSSTEPRRLHEHRASERNGSLRTLAREVRAFEVAQISPANGYIPGSPTGQNTGIIGSGPNTPNCYDAVANAGVLVSGCIASALLGGFLCPPCMAYAIFGCYTAWAGANAAMELPGGACEQVPCSSGNAIPNSCDYTFTCCGQYDCCPSGDFCAPLGFCCSSGTPLVCGTTYDEGYCCPSNTVCGPHLDCLGCPQGQVAQNGQCCNFICGSDCCQSADATCDQAAGKCMYPNFGTAAPTPKPNALLRCLARSGSVICRAHNQDGSSSDICCSPKVNCCAGVCCPPGQTCGGLGSAFGCGIWIK